MNVCVSALYACVCMYSLLHLKRHFFCLSFLCAHDEYAWGICVNVCVFAFYECVCMYSLLHLKRHLFCL